ncbi:MAG: hypothetical protein AAGA76_02760 [Pseudomonadota bacterium]
MTDKKSGAHWSFWIIGILALIWNVLGMGNFLSQLDPETVSSMPESHRALIENRPLWGTIAFGLAVFGGALGCLLLLLRQRLAVPVLLLSFIGVIVQLIPSLIVMGSGVRFSTFEIILAFLMPVVVALFLIWYARLKLA